MSNALATILRNLCLGILFLSGTVPATAQVDFELAKAGTTSHSVVVGSNASDAVRASAGELAEYLNRITGATFEIKTGNGQMGIVLGLPDDFDDLPLELPFEEDIFKREHYLIKSEKNACYLLGATDLALSHAVWDFLHRIGYRQFFPGDHWEIVPRNPDLTIRLDVVEQPSFYARNIWYNWGLWGYNDEPYRDWCRRNRMAKGFDLQSGHAYESIIHARREEFEKHPEYFSWIDGKRTTEQANQKFCISNPGLRKLVVDFAVETFRNNPRRDSISMDPSDGGGWCQCEECQKLGGPSDRVVLLAGEVDKAVNQLGLGEKFVGFYAYNEHSLPPTSRISEHCIPSVTTAFLHGGLSFDQVLEAWQRQGATRIGTYDYLSVVAWDWNMPRTASATRIGNLAEFLPRLHEKGVRFYDAESGDCWGPCGLGYYFASRVLWDIREAKRQDEIVRDFLEKCFEDAAEPMREFYRLITVDTQRRSHSDLIGRMFRLLDEARKTTSNPDVRKRLDDLILYTRYAELHADYSAGKQTREEVARYAYRIRKTMMIHSYGLLCRLIGQAETLNERNPLWNDAPFEDAEIDLILASGIKKNVPVEPGFTSRSFGKELVPAAEVLKFPETPPGYFPTESQEQQDYWIWIPEKTDRLDLKITVQPLWKNRKNRISLFSPKDVSINIVDTKENYESDGKEHAISLKTPYSGLYRVESVDGADFTKIIWPENLPVTLESDVDSPGVTKQFRGNWTLYFYVPKGTEKIGGWASRVADWAPRSSGKLLDPDGAMRYDFGEHEEGWFCVDVPEGTDGKLWKFQDNNGQRLLMTVPPYLARTGKELLLPKEVIENDGK